MTSIPILASALLSFSTCAPAPVPTSIPDPFPSGVELMTNREMYSDDRFAHTRRLSRYERRHPVLTQKEKRGIRRLALQSRTPYRVR